jgi:hypothetical protein
VRDRIDPDEEYVYVRPGVLARDGVKCITLLEHLLFHLKYFRETGKFLDRNARQTLCAGSHYSDGGVVAVFVDKSHSHETCIGIRVGFNKGPYSTRKVNA